MNKQTPIAATTQTGFGLVELMIAMTIGFIVLGSVGYLYLGSRNAFRTTDNMSRMQESARFALDTLGRDIRMAGYVGCGNLATATVNTIANGAPVISPSTAIVGYDSGSGWTNPTTITRAAGDVVVMQAAYGGGVSVTGNWVPSNANIQVNGNPYGFKQDDVLVVSSCTNADVFKVTNNPGSSGIVTLSHSNSSNTGNRTGTYGPDASVLAFDQYTYFIGANPAGRRALYRVSLREGTQELVENIEDMQVLFGQDTNNDGVIDAYNTATTVGGNWSQVMAARINLLISSPENNVTPSAQTYIFDKASVTAGDRRMYQTFTVTIGIRNRLP